MLLMALLLPLVASGQSLTQEKLRQINTQLGERLADTTRVRLMLAVSDHVAAHADRNTARDSALQFAKDAMTLSTKIGYDSGIYKAYLKEIALWVHVRDLELAQRQDAAAALDNKRAAEARLFAFVQKNDSPDQLGEAYMDVVGLYKDLTDYAEMLLLYDSAAACFRRSGNARRESEALYGVGFNYNQLGKLKESLPIYHRSIMLAEPTGGPHLYKVYGILGHCYTLLGGYNIGLKYELKALQLAEAARDTTDEAGAIHLFLGMTYDRLKNYAAAREHCEKGYRIDSRDIARHPGDFFYLAVNLAKTMAMTNPRESIDFLTRFKEEHKAVINTPVRANAVTNRLMQSYMRLNDYATAQTYANELMAAAEVAPRPYLPDYMSISEFLVLSKQYHAAEKYLTVAERISKEQKRMPNMPNIYLLWFKVDSAKRDYVTAIEMFKLHKAYSDSMLNDIKAKEVALLEIEYETEKKEQSIALLTKDSELGRQQLAQSRFQNNAVWTGLAVAVLILGLLYRQYRTKKKNNTELTRRQQEIQVTNGLLQKTVLEKEWLLKEVHHRVKNNLQTVVSLLGSQSYALQSSEAASAIHDSQNRVHAMSLIHQKLYLTEHRTSINMAGYLGELTEHLRDSFPTGRMIHFELYIQPIELDVSQAIPVGLILNEAITNAIKYAFPAELKENCRVVISMHQDAARNVLLTIADNGRGLPPDFDGSGNDFGMGLRLMHGLTSEIGGSCKISSNEDTGVSIEITFNASALLE
jgi:two-component sensor histidine kinase